MQLEFHEEIKEIEGCPPDARPTPPPGYFHFVFLPLDSHRNFLPARKKSSSRDFRGTAAQCASWGLSMFESEEEAIEFFQEFSKGFPNFRKKIGSHFVELSIDATHGHATASRKDGHFTLFVAEGVDLAELVLETTELS